MSVSSLRPHVFIVQLQFCLSSFGWQTKQTKPVAQKQMATKWPICFWATGFLRGSQTTVKNGERSYLRITFIQFYPVVGHLSVISVAVSNLWPCGEMQFSSLGVVWAKSVNVFPSINQAVFVLEEVTDQDHLNTDILNLLLIFLVKLN